MNHFTKDPPFLVISGFKTTQSVFSCSKLTIETLEQGAKYVQIVLVFLLLTLHVNADWVMWNKKPGSSKHIKETFSIFTV